MSFNMFYCMFVYLFQVKFADLEKTAKGEKSDRKSLVGRQEVSSTRVSF